MTKHAQLTILLMLVGCTEIPSRPASSDATRCPEETVQLEQFGKVDPLALSTSRPEVNYDPNSGVIEISYEPAKPKDHSGNLEACQASFGEVIFCNAKALGAKKCTFDSRCLPGDGCQLHTMYESNELVGLAEELTGRLRIDIRDCWVEGCITQRRGATCSKAQSAEFFIDHPGTSAALKTLLAARQGIRTRVLAAVRSLTASANSLLDEQKYARKELDKDQQMLWSLAKNLVEQPESFTALFLAPGFGALLEQIQPAALGLSVDSKSETICIRQEAFEISARERATSAEPAPAAAPANDEPSPPEATAAAAAEPAETDEGSEDDNEQRPEPTGKSKYRRLGALAVFMVGVGILVEGGLALIREARHKTPTDGVADASKSGKISSGWATSKKLPASKLKIGGRSLLVVLGAYAAFAGFHNLRITSTAFDTAFSQFAKELETTYDLIAGLLEELETVDEQIRNELS